MACGEERLIKNYSLFISLYENKTTEVKIANVERCVREGADINARDANNKQNTPLHIAAQRGDKEILQLLIDKGAILDQKNSEGKSPLELANNLIDTENRTQIVALLNTTLTRCNNKQTTAVKSEESKKKSQKKNSEQSEKQNKTFFYPKRAGTSGVSGQLYETKLLSLVLLRALNDTEIKKFHLGTNISGIGALDDICMRYEVMGHTNPIMVFLQAKHREDRDKNRLTVEDVCNETGDFSLPKYFDSYLRIKESFRANNEDILFQGKYNNVECNLIIYTPAKDDFRRKRAKPNELSVKVNNLIETAPAVFFQYEHKEEDITFLTKMTVEDRIRKLGPTFLHFVMAEKDKFEMMMTDDLIKRYHVVLGREVIQVLNTELKQAPVPSTSKDIPDKSKLYHMAKFRPQFFTSKSEFLICLREAFYKEISSTHCDKTSIAKDEVLNSIESVLQNPCAFTISKVISKIVTYNEKLKILKLVENNNITKEFKGNLINQVIQNLDRIKIEPETIKEAIQLKLESILFKLPTSFGNLDMTIRGSGAKVSRRIDEVADKIVEKVLKSNTISNGDNIIEVEINDDLVGSGEDQISQGFIDINGGIGGAVGNALILDEHTNMIKFDTKNIQPPKANELIRKMTERIGIQMLEKYRIRMNINGFPKYSFDGDEYDKRQAKEFLDKLWFYTNQAKENEVEQILKKEIKQYYPNNEGSNNQFMFRIRYDAIYLRSHDEIQKWWMQSGKAAYLTKADEFFERAKKDVTGSPLLTLLNLMYINKIKKLDVEFNEDSINALELGNNLEGLVNVITEANVLSGIKIMQYFHDYDSYAFIDFDYVLSLPLNDYNTMIGEIKDNTIKNLIIMYDKLKYYEGVCPKLNEIISTFSRNRTIIVTDAILGNQLKEECIKKYKSVHDNKTSLIDLNEMSQKRILTEARVVFQGKGLSFSPIVDEKSRGLIRTKLLVKLLNGEKIEVGHTILDENYMDVKDHYIDRYLRRNDDRVQVDTLNDINDKIVVLSGTSGIGKSSLLSHLCYKTKLIDPLPWLVRINLPHHEREFRMWQEEEIKIDSITAIKFLTNVALKNSELKNLELSEDSEIILTDAEDIADPVALFELELFISLYNDDKVVFIFDDFNAICPHYEKEVTNILNVLKESSKRMWIATCSYKHTKSALERIFGTTYTLEPFDADGRKNFLHRFFSTNLKLELLNYDQFENIYSFLKHVSKSLRLRTEPHREFVPVLSLLFHYVYISAANFFKSEINHVSPSLLNDKLKEEFDLDLNQYTPVDTILGRTPDDEELELAGTPLHIYLAANYFKCRIEDCFAFVPNETECRNKWDLITNTAMLYKNFIEDEMGRLLHKDYDVSDDDDHSIVSFRSNKREFLNKHKKLGLFTICRENDLTKLLREEEIIEIKDTIRRIERGEEKSCFVDCVVDEIPRFGHLIFAEYFAMEGLTDLIKKVSDDSSSENPLKNSSFWRAALNILLFNAPPGVRRAFDYKLQSDSEFAEIANSDICKKVLFEVLLKDNRSRVDGDTALGEALQDRLFNVLNLFLSTVQCNLNRGNVDEVIDLIKRSHLIVSNFRREYEEMLDSIVESLRTFDAKKLSRIIGSGALTEIPLRHAQEYCSSPAVNDLTRRVASTTEQLPALVESLQQICAGAASVAPLIGDALVAVAERGMKTYLDDFMNRLHESDRD